MFLGYNTDSVDDVYRMWNPKTKRIHRTRYIIWLKIMYYQVKLKKARQLGVNVIEVGENESVTPNSRDEYGEDSNGEDDDLSPSNTRHDDEDSDLDDEEDDDGEAVPVDKMTRSDRTVKTPSRLIKQAALVMTNDQAYYCAAIMTLSCLQTDGKDRQALEYVKSCEFACVGAGIGGGFHNTKELHVMKYKAAMETQDPYNWGVAVE